MLKAKRLLLIAIAAASLTGGCVSHLAQARALDTPEKAKCDLGDISGAPIARHEAGFIAHGGKSYLIGGRGLKPVSIFDPETGAWTDGAVPPLELHHFQPVVVGDEIWIVGAMTGPWPDEAPVGRVWRYLPSEDLFEPGIPLPEGRLRGGGGVVNYGGRIWWSGGITNGHRSGTVAWLDSYDLHKGVWRKHPDADIPRDHWQLVAHGNRLYAAGGRATSYDTGQNFEATISQGEVFDIADNTWLPHDPAFRLPTPRAGLMAHAANGQLVFVGGESGSQLAAHREVESYDVVDRRWNSPTRLRRGRHGSGIAVDEGRWFIASGSGNRGGEPELTDMECLLAPAPSTPVSAKLHHPAVFDFLGPHVDERNEVSPFTEYRLTVTFEPPDGTDPLTIRGYFAADGDAAQSGATAGNVWRAMFTPDQVGTWSWEARLAKGADLAIDTDHASGETIHLSQASGRFTVTPSDASGTDWRAPSNGKLIARDGRYIKAGSGDVWLKSGSNSPENLLAYEGFDSTYRIEGNAREGEADSGNTLHRFAAHKKDASIDDPLWRAGEGKGLLGALNYLSASGVNAVYFLTWNVGGDGKDVWPYLDPDDPTRFDVSKLDQWEIAFSHMQSRGIALHIVLQETENELLMDDGDTGRTRKLYLAELVARFGHHNALVWNLGEENGPVHWRPEGQDDAQRKAMIDWLTAIDPYSHPVLLHTHSEPADKDAIIGPLLGYPGLDGLSLQISDPARVHAETLKWAKLSRTAGSPWVLSMDEVGPWQDGAKPDANTIDGHARLAREVLWGHLLAGGTGVEWYFGARHPHNDLTAEDFRSRDTLWRASSEARQMIERLFVLDTTEVCAASLSVNPCLAGQTKEGGKEAKILLVPAGADPDVETGLFEGEVSWRGTLAPLKTVQRDGTRDQIAVIRTTTD